MEATYITWRPKNLPIQAKRWSILLDFKLTKTLAAVIVPLFKDSSKSDKVDDASILPDEWRRKRPLLEFRKNVYIYLWCVSWRNNKTTRPNIIRTKAPLNIIQEGSTKTWNTIYSITKSNLSAIYSRHILNLQKICARDNGSIQYLLIVSWVSLHFLTSFIFNFILHQPGAKSCKK